MGKIPWRNKPYKIFWDTKVNQTVINPLFCIMEYKKGLDRVAKSFILFSCTNYLFSKNSSMDLYRASWKGPFSPAQLRISS